MSYNAIRENKILAKISGFTVYPIFISFTHLSLPSRARCLCHSQVILNTIILRATIAVNVHNKKDKRGHNNRF